MEFKATYYRKRDAAKKRMQDRLQKSKQRKDSFSVSNHKISERKSRQRVHRTGLQLQMQSPEKMSDYNRSNSNSHSVSGIRSSNLSLSAGVDSAVDAAVASVTRSAALLAGIDSTTDDSSTTSSPAITPGTVTTRPAAERATSRLMYSFPEHDGMSSEGETHNDSTMSSHL
ncbi:hypothetical protein BX070DRAFT_236490 [Coemansia spiralis]|nr:hypothetical protein BX070DRAFT_236490 [Coemansia spiralis]